MGEPLSPDEIEPVIGGGEDLGTLDALGLAEALAQVALRTTPAAAARRLSDLVAEWGRIALGRSTVAPEPRDWRFKNRAWTEHPLFRRLGQSYLAWSNAAVSMVDDAGLESLKGLTDLEFLFLHKTRVTDAGLKHLIGLKHLQILNMENTQVTSAAVEAFQKDRPKLQISH